MQTKRRRCMEICSQKDRWSHISVFPNSCIILQLVNTGFLNVVVLSSSHSTSGDSWESAQRLRWIWWVSLLNSQKPDPTNIRGRKVFCAFWRTKLNPLGEMGAVAGTRKGQWGQLGDASFQTCRAAGEILLLGTRREQTPWDTGTELQAGGSHDAVDFVSRFGRESQHVWPLQVGGCYLCAVQGHSSMNGGINWEHGCSSSSEKLLGACLCPFHSFKARALHGIKAYGTNKADLRRWSPGGKSI